MNKPNFSQFAKSVKKTVVKHSPEILTALGIVGMFTAGALAVKETPKALQLIEEKKKEQQVDKLKPLEVVKVTWKNYIPSVAMATVSTACLIGASNVNSKRNAALATAYTLSETALREYKAKVVETIGEKKEEAIRESIVKDKMEQNPANNNTLIVTGKGTTRCYDAWSDRYFQSDLETIRKVVNELNRRMRSDMYVSVNEYYAEIGLPPHKPGDVMGWNIDRGYIDISPFPHMGPDEQPCIGIDFQVAPQYDYNKLY